MFKNIIFLLIAALLLSSCFKEDDTVPVKISPVQVVVIPMGQYYTYQVYFDLNQDSVVSSNLKSAFDLSFSSGDSSWVIRLNTSTFMKAAMTDQTELAQVMDTTGLDWQFDNSNGDPDSTALFDWMSISGNDTIFPGKVYVINRGINELGVKLGLRKIIFEKLKNGTFYFRYSNMDNTGLVEASVKKDALYNDVEYSFKTGNLAEPVQPPTDNWDLLFTQYTTLLYTDQGDAYPYLVTGTLTNMGGTSVAFDSTLVFSHISMDDVQNLDFSTRQDAIGYDWKELFGDINGGDYYYKAQENYNYIIHSRSGVYYKLRFVGFYNADTGEKGYPTFEYQRL
jgi:hypothetical protein